MPPTTYLRERKRLAARLKDLRKAADVSGNALAKRLGWAQSKISRIENAKQLPTDDDIRAWAQAVGASSQTLGELLGVRREAAITYATHAGDYRALGGAAAKQLDVLALEASATRIGEFQPAMIPGLLQTAAYAEHVLRLPCGPTAWGADAADIAQAVANRMRRQQAVLYASGKRIEMVVLEAALHTRIAPPPVLEGQLDRLLAVLGLPALRLGVVPFTADVPIYPFSGFALFDDLAVLESVDGELRAAAPEQVAVYDRALKQLLDVAAKGDAAAAVIQRALTALREQP